MSYHRDGILEYWNDGILEYCTEGTPLAEEKDPKEPYIFPSFGVIRIKSTKNIITIRYKKKYIKAIM